MLTRNILQSVCSRTSVPFGAEQEISHPPADLKGLKLYNAHFDLDTDDLPGRTSVGGAAGKMHSKKRVERLSL